MRGTNSHRPASVILPPAIMPPTFTYAGFPPDETASLRQCARTIRGRIATTTDTIIKTGQDLASVKQRLDHGQFIDWVEAEIGINARTAQRYIAAAKWAEGKYDTVSHLALGVIYKLSAKGTPPEVSAAVLAKAEAGEIVSDDMVKAMVKEVSSQRRQAKKHDEIAIRRSKRRMEDRRRRDAAERLRLQEEREAREERNRAMAREIVRRFGAEDASFIMKAFRDCWNLGEALRLEIEQARPESESKI